MKRLMNILLLISLPVLGFAQRKVKADTTIYKAVEIQPQFPGGEAAFGKFLQEHLRYPDNSKDELLDSRCFIRFIVEKNGTLSNFVALRGSPLISDMIIKLLKAGPKWKPGMTNGKILRTEFTIPIQLEFGME